MADAVIITSVDHSVIAVCTAEAPCGSNCVETPFCNVQDILSGRPSLPGRASEQTKLIILHSNNDKKHGLPQVVTQEVLDGAVNTLRTDSLLKRGGDTQM